MANIPNDVKSRINDMFNQRKKSQLNELRQSQQRAVGQIKDKKQKTDKAYYGKRNQADVVNMQNQRALREQMAASGLGRSGANISGQVSLQAARQNVLGDLNSEEQQIMNQFNNQITDINDPSRANNIISELESQRSAALAQALERAIERQRQKEQFEREMAFRQQQADRDYQLALKRMRSSGGGGGGRRSSGGISDSDLLDIMYRNSPQVVDADDADSVLNEESVNRGQMNDYAAMREAYEQQSRRRARSRLGGPQMIR